MKKGIKIVLAEDDTTFALLLKFRLVKEGFELFVADNGQQAIDLIEKHFPDIVLTDIMLPFLNGLEVTTHIRNKLKWDIPVIVFSAAGQEQMVLKAFKLGATDFLRKPFSPQELIIRVKNIAKSITRSLNDGSEQTDFQDYVIIDAEDDSGGSNHPLPVEKTNQSIDESENPKDQGNPSEHFKAKEASGEPELKRDNNGHNYEDSMTIDTGLLSWTTSFSTSSIKDFDKEKKNQRDDKPVKEMKELLDSELEYNEKKPLVPKGFTKDDISALKKSTGCRDEKKSAERKKNISIIDKLTSLRFNNNQTRHQNNGLDSDDTDDFSSFVQWLLSAKK